MSFIFRKYLHYFFEESHHADEQMVALQVISRLVQTLPNNLGSFQTSQEVDGSGVSLESRHEERRGLLIYHLTKLQNKYSI